MVNSARDRRLIALYNRRADSPETFSVGWIVGLSEECYIFATVDEVARADSYQVGYVEDVYKVVESGDYLRAIGRMMMNHVDAETADIPEPSVAGTLNWARERHQLVSIHDRMGFVTHGHVVETDEEAISLHSCDKVGGDEGNLVVLIADVFGVEFGGPMQRNVASLIG